ncbi:uncharacterized protein METZ01_LOCUS275000, partial [marine metagenome]
MTDVADALGKGFRRLGRESHPVTGTTVHPQSSGGVSSPVHH